MADCGVVVVCTVVVVVGFVDALFINSQQSGIAHISGVSGQGFVFQVDHRLLHHTHPPRSGYQPLSPFGQGVGFDDEAFGQEPSLL